MIALFCLLVGWMCVSFYLPPIFKDMTFGKKREIIRNFKTFEVSGVDYFMALPFFLKVKGYKYCIKLYSPPLSKIGLTSKYLLILLLIIMTSVIISYGFII